MEWGLFGRVLVLVDAANLNMAAVDLGFKVNYWPLGQYLRARTRLVRMVYYTATFGTPAHTDFLRAMNRYGYRIETKPVKVIDSRPGTSLRKANFDVEITLDAMDWLEEYDTLALFSGDSDFHALVKRLQSKGKKVVVCSVRGHIARELLLSADHYQDVRRMSAKVTQKTR